MYQASQRAIVQNANMVLINIRTAEIDYFSSFFANFGTQAAIIAGIISGVVSQTPGLEDYPCNWFWCFLYFTSSAGALVGALHVLLTTLFTAVYGQGLALRGPLGSMSHTIDGMVFEQHQIVWAFNLTIVCFVLQEAGMFMIVMDEFWGYVSVAIVLIGALFTYNYSLRIYNRFYFDKEKVEWSETEANPVEEFNQMFSPADGINKPTSQHQQPQSHSPKTPVDAQVPASSADSASVSNFTSSGVAESVDSSLTPADSPAMMEGYLSMKNSKRFTIDNYERRYFVLMSNTLFYYKEKRSYQLSPAEPINRRPIDLEGYSLVTGTAAPPFALSLVPTEADDIRKTWKFRCDTLPEFNKWIEIFTKALKACNKEER